MSNKNVDEMNIEIDLVNPPINVSKKVALIGNSDVLLNKEYGTEINRYGTVIRFNLARTISKYSGTKTTMRVFGGPIGFGQFREAQYNIKTENDRRTELVKMTSGCTILVTSRDLENELKSINPKADIHYMNDMQLFNNCNNLLAKLNISKRFTSKTGCARTGFITLLLLIVSGVKPDLYGFDWDKRKGYRHYYGTEIKNTGNTSRHEEITEVEIIDELEKKGLIILHK